MVIQSEVPKGLENLFKLSKTDRKLFEIGLKHVLSGGQSHYVDRNWNNPIKT